jgi:hypothetical protein
MTTARVREVLDALLDAERVAADAYRLLLKSYGTPREAAARAAADEALAAFVARYGEALDALELKAGPPA